MRARLRDACMTDGLINGRDGLICTRRFIWLSFGGSGFVLIRRYRRRHCTACEKPGEEKQCTAKAIDVRSRRCDYVLGNTADCFVVLLRP